MLMLWENSRGGKGENSLRRGIPGFHDIDVRLLEMIYDHIYKAKCERDSSLIVRMSSTVPRLLSPHARKTLGNAVA